MPPASSRLKRVVQRVSAWMFALLEVVGLPPTPRKPQRAKGGNKT